LREVAWNNSVLLGGETSSTGVIMTVDRPAGAIDRGSFASERPPEEELERRRHLDP
jgi:hypothetical protein